MFKYINVIKDNERVWKCSKLKEKETQQLITIHGPKLDSVLGGKVLLKNNIIGSIHKIGY